MASKTSKPTDLPSAARVGQMRAWLAHHGVPAQVANSIVKTTRTMWQIDGDLRIYLRDRSKGQTNK